MLTLNPHKIVITTQPQRPNYFGSVQMRNWLLQYKTAGHLDAVWPIIITSAECGKPKPHTCVEDESIRALHNNPTHEKRCFKFTGCHPLSLNQTSTLEVVVYGVFFSGTGTLGVEI